LSTILLRWPSSRFPVCNDVELMKVLANMHTKTDSYIKLVLLKLYTSLGIKISISYRSTLVIFHIFCQLFKV
jgi:hypothetical protein